MNYSITEIKTVETPGEGYLSFFEGNGRDFEFPIKRIYYIHGVDKGIKRGGHAHKKLKQVIFCPYGSIEILLNDGSTTESVLLDSPNKAIIIDTPLWREMVWNTPNSVLCVAASDFYDETDYIRNYKDYCEYIGRT